MYIDNFIHDICTQNIELQRSDTRQIRSLLSVPVGESALVRSR